MVIALILAGEVRAQTPAAPCAPNVMPQISALRRYADGMGFTLWVDAPEGSLSHHYQGVQRLIASLGIPYLIYARSGGPGENHVGDFGIMKMASRGRTPERLRSIRLSLYMNIESTPPNFPNSGNGGDRLNANFFLDFDLGFFDQDEGRVEPASNPFGPEKVSTMSPE